MKASALVGMEVYVVHRLWIGLKHLMVDVAGGGRGRTSAGKRDGFVLVVTGEEKNIGKG